MSALPPEMISDILCRLPVKSLLRFRCTSKPFFSLIDGPDFIKLHLNQTNSNQSLILSNWNCPLFSIDLPSLKRAVEIEHPIKTLQGNSTQLIGSCNGLLCLCNSKSEAEIVLWNMSTRKHHRLPYIHTIFPNQAATYINSHQVAYGFGYDSVHDDHKLVRIVRFRDTLDSEVMVYSLKSNSWKNLLTRFPYDLVCMRSMGLFSNIALHWLINHPVIVAFDVAAEEFREVALPPDAPCKEYFELLWVFESRLCVIRNHDVKVAEIWVLKHYGVEESWTKLLSISDPQVTSPHCVVPMAYLSNGNELLLLQDNHKFLCYDLKTNKVKNVMIQGMPTMFDVIPYAESLVKPSPMVNATMGKHKSKKNATKRDDFLSKGFKLVL